MAQHPTPATSAQSETSHWWLRLGLGALVVLSLLGLLQVPHWSRQQQLKQYLPGAWEQTWRDFDAINRDFGFGQSLILTLQAPPKSDVFAPAMMRLNRELTRRLKQLSGVQRVLSLSNSVTLRKQGDAMVVRPLMPRDLKAYGAAQQKQIRRLVLADPLLRGSLVAASGRATLVLAFLQPQPHASSSAPLARGKGATKPKNVPLSHSATVHRVLDLIEALRHKVPGTTWGVVGQPFVGPLLEQQLQKQLPLVGALLLLWLVLLVLLFVPTWRRKGWFVALSLSATFLALASHTGWHNGLHLSALWIPLWVWWAMGLWAMFGATSKGSNTPHPLRTWIGLGLALLATWGLSLWLHPWPMLQRWGVTLTLTLLSILALTWLFQPPTPQAETPQPATPWRWSPLASVLGSAAILFLIVGSGRLPLGISSLQHIYPRYGLLYQGEQISHEQFGGAVPFFVRFQGDLQDPVLLKAMERVGRRLEILPGVSPVQSYGVIVRQLHAMLNRLPRIPDSRLKIKSLAILLEGQPALASLIRDNNRDGIIQGRIQVTQAWQQTDLLQSFDAALQNLPLRYQPVDLAKASPSRRRTLLQQRVRWVAEGVELWLLRHTGLRLTAAQQSPLRKLLHRYLRYLHNPPKKMVLEGIRLRRRLAMYLRGEDSDLELKKAQQSKVLHALLRLNQRGTFLQHGTLQQTLRETLKGTEAGNDKQGLKYAVRSLRNIAQRLRQEQQLTLLQQSLFQLFGRSRRWTREAAQRLRAGGSRQAQIRVAELRGELLELHNQQWHLLHQGPQHLRVVDTGLHRLLLPLATLTVRHGLYAALIVLLVSFLLSWMMLRSFSAAWRVWLPIPLTLLLLLGFMGWTSIPLDPSTLFLLLFLGGYALLPSLYLYRSQREPVLHVAEEQSPRHVLIRGALWLSLPATALLLLPLPPIQQLGLLMAVGPWLALLACFPSHHSTKK